MNKTTTESMDITCSSKEELELKVEKFLAEGWETYTGIDESVRTAESGISTIWYTRTLIRKEQEEESGTTSIS